MYTYAQKKIRLKSLIIIVTFLIGKIKIGYIENPIMTRIKRKYKKTKD